MDAFEIIVTKFLEEKDYWVRTLVKIPLSKEEKRRINNPSTPTPEVDILAYNLRENELLIVECKSLLDSKGIRFESFIGKNKKFKDRYKLFNNKLYRAMITKKIKEQYLSRGLINKDTCINYALAAGKIYSKDTLDFEKYFNKVGWKFFSPEEIKKSILDYVNKDYENNLIVMTTKILNR